MPQKSSTIPALKLCKKCLQEKPVSEFYLKPWQGAKKLYYYHSSPCKSCYVDNAVRWSSANRVRSNQIKYNYIQSNPEKRKESLAKWHIKRKSLRPWETHYYAAMERTTNSNHSHYKYYGGKGIKFLLNPRIVEFLWKCDNAHLLKKPSIDRINPKGNYELSNCRFIEMSENSKRATKRNRYTAR